MIQIADLLAGDLPAIGQAADLLMEPEPFDWVTKEAALEEVSTCAQLGNVARMAVEGDTILGWIGAQPRIDNIWELHPLVVRSDRQQQGIGRSLVADMEEQVCRRGGHTIFLGADNNVRVEENRDWTYVCANISDRLRDLDSTRRRQYEFYQRVGYVIVGVVPDGRGTGNIYMAKRIET